jgi:pyruvate dehydrogenase E2 component (dihydrolipoyllysine-residue acetyltransferase)
VALQSVIMPKLGAYMEDVLLTEWLVPEGSEVKVGQVLFLLETDKTEAEAEAEADGWLHRIVEAGAKVPVGSQVGVLATTREEYEAIRSQPAPEVTDGEPAHPFLGYIDRGGGLAVAAEAGLTDPTAPSSGVAGPRRAEPSARAGALKISPRARALLAERGLPLEEAAAITGTGAEGRITDRDVAAYLEARAAGGGGPGVLRRIPLRGRRATIARRMVESLQTAAQLTSVLELDVARVVELRRRLNEAGAQPRVGYTAIFVKLVAASLRSHPLLNSRIERGEIELLEEVNVGVAVDTHEGVAVPVVHGADALSIEELNPLVNELASRAREGRLTPADVEGATFTLSNGGIYPVDITTAILNPPQSAILWIGRIRERPVVVEGDIVVRPTLQACLTYDHRAIDGAPAAEFLATLEELVRSLPEPPD